MGPGVFVITSHFHWLGQTHKFSLYIMNQHCLIVQARVTLNYLILVKIKIIFNQTIVAFFKSLRVRLKPTLVGVPLLSFHAEIKSVKKCFPLSIALAYFNKA